MKYYITTPIFYPNASPHIGTAYTTVAADAFARYHRMNGDDVYFLTGTDENAQKIVRTAESKGMDPKSYVDGIVERFKSLWEELDISNDDFIRTTEERHHQVVKALFTKLHDQGDIYKSEYEGWYCTPCETFWPESKLIDGKCPNPDCGRDVELLKEESYFFRLSKYQDALLKHIQENPDFIQPASRRNEMIRFVEGGLEDLCVSRTTFQWGIQVPFDPKHVVYVWLDALINYISALGYPDGKLYQKYWPADVHLMGKDIVRFHAVIWPIILIALGIPLPKKVYGHGWFLSKEGGKISKSRGNVQDSFELIRRYGSDAIRYFLLREMQVGADGTYSEDNLVDRLNSDLANDLGNFVSRSLAMIVKYREGLIPKVGEDTALEQELKALSQEVKAKVEERMEALDPAGALENIWRLVARMNKYVDETAPWALAKQEDSQARLDHVLHTFAEAIRIFAILCAPFMPKLPGKMLGFLGVDQALLRWEDATDWGIISEGTRVEKGQPLFPRVDVSQWTSVEESKSVEQDMNQGVNEQNIAPVEAVDVKSEFEPIKEEITIDDFAKIDLRVAKILQAEKVEKTDKLMKLEIEVSGEKRTIVSGIAQHYTPEDLVGKSVVIVANLKPVKLRGIVSQGMILAASQDGVLEVISVNKDLPGGARVK
ncbi:methionine--tRNA ligase [Desulfitobacterium metallireducens]|uniref:Methionine--tRNA ligase n=1 Tax=Desulfitobacterium metallireducens DSM 15288 TaxID=871968 RepID=W0E914_9FIRM|nr:methionine--tRNA ligase [Desulfitobacterium metallireducens]AHF05694.1 methionyl-tRNA synthetase [Desulfitobacterium metallireducens DSM 15288]